MKIFYYLGIYAACVGIHEIIGYCAEPIDIILKKKFREKFVNKKESKEERRSINLSEGTTGKVINRIGF